MGLISRVSSRTYRTDSDPFKSCLPHETANTSKSTDEKRPLPPSLSAKPVKVLSKSTDDLSTKSSQKLFDSNSKNHSWFADKNDFLPLTSKSKSAVVDELLKSMLSDKPSLGLLSLTTKNTSTSTPNES